MAEKSSMVDKVPTQLDEEELKAEMDVEIPEAMDVEEIPENVEIVEEEDGSVVIDFDPKDDKGRDTDCREECMGTSIIAHCDAPPILEFGKHIFDFVTLFI